MLRRFATLVLAEHNGSKLLPGCLSAVTAGTKIPGGVHVLVTGHQMQSVANHAASIQGVEKVLQCDSQKLEKQSGDQVAAVVKTLLDRGGYSHVIAAASAFSKDVVPRLGGLLSLQPITEVTSILAPDHFKRPIYAGSAISTVRSSAAIKLMTIRSTAFDKAAEGNTAAIEPLQVDIPAPLTQWVSEEVVKSDKPDLGSARIVVTGGRAVKSKANWPMIEALSDALGAATGATRAAVDADYCPNSLQVGQTGKVVAPELYIALGVSGAIQHIAGMKDSKVIVAVNTDPECPMVQLADYSLIGDIFKVVPELTEKAKS